MAIGVLGQILLQLVRRIGVYLPDETEVFHFKEFGNTLADLALVVIDGMEGGARWQDGGNHLQNYYFLEIMKYRKIVIQKNRKY